LPPPSSPLDAPGVLSIVSAGAAGALKALKQNGAGLISDLSGCAPGAPGIDCSSRRLLATSLVIMAAGLAAATALYACTFLPRYRRRRESRAHTRLLENDSEAALQEAVESREALPQVVSRSRRQPVTVGRGRGAALGSTESVAAPRARPASGPTVPPGSESADVEEEEWEEEVEERKGEKRPLSPVPLPPEEERESVPQESRIRRMANVLFVWVQRSPAGRPMLTW